MYRLFCFLSVLTHYTTFFPLLPSPPPPTPPSHLTPPPHAPPRLPSPFLPAQVIGDIHLFGAIQALDIHRHAVCIGGTGTRFKLASLT